jgi:hypothetical protein
MEKNELEAVLDNAVEAYLICKSRNRPTVKLPGELHEIYPNHFHKMDNGCTVWIGDSADDIIENYLSQFGYKPASHLSHQLTCIVIMRARRQAATTSPISV